MKNTPKTEHNPYVYNAIVTKVYDGDTITVDIDLGLNITKKNVKLRLLSINTPEMGTEAGVIARDYLRKRILNKEVLIYTFKDKKGKYGRYLATVYVNGVNINKEMLEIGLAERYNS